MLMGDTRECAKAVNGAILAARRAPAPEAVEGGRQKGRLERVFLFSHYDSRGGSTMVVAEGIGEALVKYSRAFGIHEVFPQGSKDFADAIHGLFENDFQACVEVVFCDGAVPLEEVELDEEYDEEAGFRYGRVERRQASKGPWRKTGTMVLWKGPRPKLSLENDGFWEYRLSREKLGEDAFGLILVP